MNSAPVIARCPACAVTHRHPEVHSKPLREPGWARLLSAREADVLHCLARGLSNAEIATELYVSLPTVKTHVARLLHKVQARDRLQLVVEAYQSGYVQPGRPRPPMVFEHVLAGVHRHAS